VARSASLLLAVAVAPEEANRAAAERADGHRTADGNAG
jgi:hypothetical protein